MQVILNKASKIIHVLLDFPALGDILGKKVDLTLHIATNHEILLKFNILKKKNPRKSDPVNLEHLRLSFLKER